MYDYATVTQQLKILNELQILNTNFSAFNDTVVILLVLFIIVFMSFCVYKFILRCLGK